MRDPWRGGLSDLERRDRRQNERSGKNAGSAFFPCPPESRISGKRGGTPRAGRLVKSTGERSAQVAQKISGPPEARAEEGSRPTRPVPRRRERTRDRGLCRPIPIPAGAGMGREPPASGKFLSCGRGREHPSQASIPSGVAERRQWGLGQQSACLLPMPVLEIPGLLWGVSIRRGRGS